MGDFGASSHGSLVIIIIIVVVLLVLFGIL